jgi:iron complex transport system substrate-binding protein
VRARLAALLLAVPGLIGAAPAGPPAIADLWYAHNAMTVMLGAADRVRVTVASPAAQPWMFRVAPALSRAQIVANGSANAETLLGRGVTLAFTAQPAEAERLRRFGIDARAMGFTDVAGFAKSLRETAAAIGTPTARTRLHDYQGYTAAVIRRLRAAMSGLPEERKPRVLHLASWSPLKADGADTMIDQWIRLAGGRNAADGLHGNLQPVSIEQVLRWNPDVIIVGGTAKNPDDQPWKQEPALAGRHIVRNPSGVFPWDRYGPEFALQLQWAAKLLHPDRMGTIDLPAETARFYHRFYGYRPSVEETGRILRAEPPPS